MAPSSSTRSDSSPSLPREPGLAQLGLAHLAVRVARELVHELDHARTLVVGKVVAAPGDHAFGVERRAGARLHDGVEDLAPAVVGHAEHGAVDHVGMLMEGILDLAWIDVHSPRDDHVALAVGEEEVAVLVQVAGVTDGEPPAAMGGSGLLGVVVVLEARRGRPGVDRSDLPRRQRVAGVLEPLLRADDGAAALGRAEVLPDLVGADEVHERALEWHGARRGRVYDDLE